MLDRGSRLVQYRFQWPALDAALLASLMRGLMLALMLIGVVWLMSRLVRRLNQSQAGGESAPQGAAG
jgi:flagellar biogenesis protein FliO